MLIALAISVLAPRTNAQQTNPFLGVWNITGTGPDTSYVYWLEVKEEGGKLSGSFLNRTSNPYPLAIIKIENSELIFQGALNGQATGPEYRARAENGKLVGNHTLTTQARPANGDRPATPASSRVVNWVGTHPPAFPPSNANGRHTYGTPVALADGKSMDAFDVQFANRPMGWSVTDGVMTNT